MSTNHDKTIKILDALEVPFNINEEVIYVADEEFNPYENVTQALQLAQNYIPPYIEISFDENLDPNELRFICAASDTHSGEIHMTTENNDLITAVMNLLNMLLPVLHEGGWNFDCC